MKEGLIDSLEDSQLVGKGSKKLAILLMKVKKMVQRFKTHRCTMNFGQSFCKSIHTETRTHLVKIVLLFIFNNY
jgi:hypothetical protein